MKKTKKTVFSESTMSVNSDVKWASNLSLSDAEIKELFNDPDYLMANDKTFIPIQRLISFEKRSGRI